MRLSFWGSIKQLSGVKWPSLKYEILHAVSNLVNTNHEACSDRGAHKQGYGLRKTVVKRQPVAEAARS